MKVFISVFLSAVMAFSPVYTLKYEVVESQGFMADAVIRQLFEMLRGVINKGDSDKNIPVLDPMKTGTINIDHEGTLLNLTAKIQDGVFDGLGGFRVGQAHFVKSDLSMDLEVTFPSIKFNAGNYSMNGLLFDFILLRGDGKINIEIEDLKLTSKVYLKQSDDGLSVLIDRLDGTYYEIKRITSRTEFDNNMDGIFNAMIEDLSAYYLNRFSSFISKVYCEDIVSLFNPFLNKFETWRVISTIL